MPINYKDTFYNHFENQEYKASLSNQAYEIAHHINKENNLLLRYKVRIPYFNFQRNNLTIRYFKKGSGVLSLDGQAFRIRNEQFLVLNPNEGWEYFNEQNDYIDVLSFGISDTLLAKHQFYLKQDTEGLLDNPWGMAESSIFFLEKTLNANHYSSGRSLQYLYELSNQPDFRGTCPDELTIAMLQSLCHQQQLGHKIIKKIDAKKSSTKIETLKRLLSAYEFIHDNIQKPISLDYLSYISCLSKFHLYDSFKKAFGKTPHQYINRLKLYKAKKMLQTVDVSVSEVAETFGFSDISVFSKAFKKAYGKAPSHYLR